MNVSFGLQQHTTQGTKMVEGERASLRLSVAALSSKHNDSEDAKSKIRTRSFGFAWERKWRAVVWWNEAAFERILRVVDGFFESRTWQKLLVKEVLWYTSYYVRSSTSC